MSGQYIAAAIMFFITIGFTALFWLPALKVSQKCEVISFYWTGFWMFLGFLMALAGAQSVLMILGQDIAPYADAILTGVTASFITFVMFAWGRIGLRGANSLFEKVKDPNLTSR